MKSALCLALALSLTANTPALADPSNAPSASSVRSSVQQLDARIAQMRREVRQAQIQAQGAEETIALLAESEKGLRRINTISRWTAAAGIITLQLATGMSIAASSLFQGGVVMSPMAAMAQIIFVGAPVMAFLAVTPHGVAYILTKPSKEGIEGSERFLAELERPGAPSFTIDASFNGRLSSVLSKIDAGARSFDELETRVHAAAEPEIRKAAHLSDLNGWRFWTLGADHVNYIALLKAEQEFVQMIATSKRDYLLKSIRTLSALKRLIEE